MVCCYSAVASKLASVGSPTADFPAREALRASGGHVAGPMRGRGQRGQPVADRRHAPRGAITLALEGALIPPGIKVLYTLFICILVPVYWVHYGPKNFLWFSDVALFTTAAALWLESPLLASMMTVAIALPELAWNVDFLSRLLTGRHVFGLSRYMFDSRTPLYLRTLSLFHVPLPAVLIWMVHRLGYDRRAWVVQSALALIVLPLTYWLTEPADNINWVYGPGDTPQAWMPPRVYLAMLMVSFPLVMYLPTHLLMLRLFGSP